MKLVCVPPLTSVPAVRGPGHPLPAAAEWPEKQVSGDHLLSKEIYTVTPIIANIKKYTQQESVSCVGGGGGARSLWGSNLEAIHSLYSQFNQRIYLLTWFH